jgi:K+-transporting ATPase ATPase A chain
MAPANWVQLGVLVVLLVALTPPLGAYLARVFGDGPAPGDRVFGPVERLVYRVCGIDERREQRWNVYALSLLAFSAVSVLFLYLLQRVQHVLPLNPTDVHAVSPSVAWNTSVSFVTNTNWQSYSGESTMSHLTQMAGLAVQNFASAAVGLAVAVALVRGSPGAVRRRSATSGST